MDLPRLIPGVIGWRYSPSLEMAFQIAQVFKVPLDEVFQYPDGEAGPR